MLEALRWDQLAAKSRSRPEQTQFGPTISLDKIDRERVFARLQGLPPLLGCRRMNPIIVDDFLLIDVEPRTVVRFQPKPVFTLRRNIKEATEAKSELIRSPLSVEGYCVGGIL